MSELHYCLYLGPNDNRIVARRDLLIPVRACSMEDLWDRREDPEIEELHEFYHVLWEKCREEKIFRNYHTFDEAIARRIAIAYTYHDRCLAACGFLCEDREIQTSTTLEYIMVSPEHRGNKVFGKSIVDSLVNYARDQTYACTHVRCRSKPHLRHFYEDICRFEVELITP